MRHVVLSTGKDTSFVLYTRDDRSLRISGVTIFLCVDGFWYVRFAPAKALATAAEGEGDSKYTRK